MITEEQSEPQAKKRKKEFEQESERKDMLERLGKISWRGWERYVGEVGKDPLRIDGGVPFVVNQEVTDL